MNMTKKDLGLVTIIGAAIGLLSQPVLANLIRGSSFLADLIGGTGLSINLRIIIVISFAILAPLALIIANFIGKFLPVAYQFAKFAAVGTLNTFINFGILNLLSIITDVTSGSLIPVFATISFLGATTNSFFWNKYWTFGSRDSVNVGEAGKFLIVTVGGWIISTIVISVVVNYLRPSGISPELWLNAGGLAGVFSAMLWNFLGYKFVVFKKTGTTTA
jgi:putative flippase GtrA